MKPYYEDGLVTILNGDALDCLASLPDESVQCCVTSPPYWGLRDYGVDGQLGLEPTPEEYVANMVAVFAGVRRVLRDDGTVWLNLGDSYASGGSGGYSDKSTLAGFTNPDTKGRVMNATPIHRSAPDGLKPKDLVGIPWRVAFALQADGWYLRSDIIWSKPNPMPESVRDRPTKAHEYVFLLSKSVRYHYDADAIAEKGVLGPHKRDRASNFKKAGSQSDEYGSHNKGATVIECDGTRNKRTVWTITTKPYPEAHFATFPPELPTLCIKAGCPKGGTVLDLFAGAGTTSFVAKEHGRKSIAVELNPEYCDLIVKRCHQEVLAL